MAVVDLDGFIASEKMHAIEHGFHVHDERHFIETYSLGQQWEVDLHPETACGGPLDLHMALEVDPRVVLAFEDRVLEDESEPEDEYYLPLYFNWVLPPLPSPPDLLVLATDLAGNFTWKNCLCGRRRSGAWPFGAASRSRWWTSRKPRCTCVRSSTAAERSASSCSTRRQAG